MSNKQINVIIRTENMTEDVVPAGIRMGAARRYAAAVEDVLLAHWPRAEVAVDVSEASGYTDISCEGLDAVEEDMVRALVDETFDRGDWFDDDTE